MKKTLLYITALLLLVSCKRNLKDVSWDSKIIAPILTTSLTIEDLIKDDTNFVRSGKEISFVYKESIKPLGIKLDTLIQLGVDKFKKTVNLETLELPEQRVSDTTYLGEIVPSSITNGSVFPSFIFDLLPATNLPPQTIDFSEYLTSAEVSEGNISLEIENQLSVVIESLTLKVNNNNDNYEIINKSFANINPGETEKFEAKLVDLMQGNTLEGKLKIEILNVKFKTQAGASSVTINYKDYIRYDMSITNMMVTKATAIFQAQEVINNPDTVGLRGMGDVVLTGALIDTGIVNVTAYNTIDAIMDFEYNLVGLTKNNTSFSIEETLNANDNIKKDIPFIGYYLNLQGHPDSNNLKNTFFNHITGKIRTTPTQVSIALEDSISIDLGFESIKPKYVEGYLGQDTFSFKTGVAIDALKDFPLGDIHFKNINLTLYLENGLGVPGKLIIKELKAINSKTGEKKSLTNIQSNIARATDVNKKLIPVETKISISGATPLINIQPDSLILDIEIITNPDGFNGSYDNLIERVSFIRPSAKIEIPFELNTAGFSLNDTVAFSINQFQIPELLRDEKLIMIIDNNIPASGTVKATFLNASGGIIDDIATNKAFSSPLIGIEGEATDTKRSSFTFSMPKERLRKILNAKQVIYTVNFNTSSVVDYVKVLSNNSLKVTLVGDVGAHIETKEF